MIYSRLRDLCYETWPKLSKNRRRPENAPGCRSDRKITQAQQEKTQVWRGKNSGFRKLSDPVVVVKLHKQKACLTVSSKCTLPFISALQL